MKSIFVISLLVAAVVAGNWNNHDLNNRNKLTGRDGKHQKFVIDLLRHLQQDIHNKDFLRYSNTIRIDNKGDYKVRIAINKFFRKMSLKMLRHVGLEQSVSLGDIVPQRMVRGSQQAVLSIPRAKHHHHKGSVRFLRHDDRLEHVRDESHLGPSQHQRISILASDDPPRHPQSPL